MVRRNLFDLKDLKANGVREKRKQRVVHKEVVEYDGVCVVRTFCDLTLTQEYFFKR